MSNRIKTISWIEGKIIETLSKRQGISSYLSLSASVLRNIRSTEEEHNLDIALTILISRREIIKTNDNGEMVYKLCA